MAHRQLCRCAIYQINRFSLAYKLENRITSSADLPINTISDIYYCQQLCRCAIYQINRFSLAYKLENRITSSADLPINTISLTYTIAKSSASVPITESTGFLWHTCLKIELPALPVCQTTQFF